MKQQTNAGVFALLVIAALLVAGCAQAGTTPAQTQQKDTSPIVIGGILPLTGDAAAMGQDDQKVLQLALDEINAQGGVAGRKLEIRFEDGGCSGKTAVAAMQKLTTVDNVKFVLGAGCSGESLAAIPIAEQSKALMFSPMSSSPALTNKSWYFTRNYPSDASSAAAIAKAAIARKHMRVAVISENTDYAQALRQVFVDTFTANGGTVVADERYSQDSSDYRAQLTKIKESGYDAIFVVPQTPAKAPTLLKQMEELGLTQPLYSTELIGTPDVLKESAKEVEGTIYATASFSENTPKAKHLMDALKAKYGAVPSALPPLYFGAAYDSVYIFKEAYESCGSMDVNCLDVYIRSIKNRDSTVGVLTMNANGDPDFTYELRTIKDGEAVTIS